MPITKKASYCMDLRVDWWMPISKSYSSIPNANTRNQVFKTICGAMTKEATHISRWIVFEVRKEADGSWLPAPDHHNQVEDEHTSS